jgi:16S rRNA (adenine1518-N6/adenine1519-N6)-dimethyltransferase
MKGKSFIQSLKEEGIVPKKSLSQNFLIDQNIRNKIVEYAHIQENDPILEIGPGLGFLTEGLLGKKAQVLAIEKDKTLVPKLKELFPFPHLTVIEADFLKTDLEELLKKNFSLNKKIKVVANLPYQILTPIIVKLLENHVYFSHLILMVQKEVAERIVSEPHSKTYGAFSVFVQFYTKPKIAFNVPAGCFHPKPKVESAIIDLEIQKPPLDHPEKFHEFVRRAFQQRRKKLTSSLKALYSKDQIVGSLNALSLSCNTRPENLSLKDWVSLYQLLIQ